MSKLEELYHRLTRTPSDINLHLPTLMELVDGFPEDAFAERARVTEFGTRHGWSTVALLMGFPRRLITYDLDPKPEDFKTIMEAWINHCGDWPEHGEDLQFIKANTLEIEIEETDILFIDTLHTGEQLSRELDRHHKKVTTYIAFHDFVSYGLTDEAPVRRYDKDYHPGLIPALFDFLTEHPEWDFYHWNPLNNGLLILKRRERMVNCHVPCPDCGAKFHYRGVP